MNVYNKVFTTIIHKGLKTVSENSLMKEQSEFRKGRSHMDNNFGAKQITVKGMARIAFISFEKHKKVIGHRELN
jgi:hypothetical protein